MGLQIVGIGSSKEANLTSVKSLPDFRKATRNMILAYHSLQEALHSAFPDFSAEMIKDFGIVLGSSSGELETTVQFLDYLGNSGLARPLLFQNSLHNSTVGFLAMKFGITGPTIAVSNHYFTGENSLEIGIQLLEESNCLFAMIVGVEAEVPRLQIHTDGAAALILAKSEVIKDFKIRPLAHLKSVECFRSLNKNETSISSSNFYETDAIARLVQTIQLSAEFSPITLNKPDGSYSKITLEKN